MAVEAARSAEQLAALMIALYPATVAIDESASIDCARLMRGTNSMLNSVTCSAMAVAKASGASKGLKKANDDRA